MALFTLGIVFAYFFRSRLRERVAIVVSTIPIAILVNSFRVAPTGILTLSLRRAGGQRGHPRDRRAVHVRHRVPAAPRRGAAPRVVWPRARRPLGRASGMIRSWLRRSLSRADYYVYYHLATEEVLPPRKPSPASRASSATGTAGSARRSSREVVTNLGVTDYLICDFERKPTTASVGLYVGYHGRRYARRAAARRQHDPSAGALPARLRVGHHRTRGRCRSTLPGLPGAPARVNRLMIAKGDAPADRRATGTRSAAASSRATGRRSSTSSGTGPGSRAPTARWSASRSRLRRRRRPRRRRLALVDLAREVVPGTLPRLLRPEG